MNKTIQTSMYTAQGMATAVMIETDAASHGVNVKLELIDGALYFMIWTLRSGKMIKDRIESTTLLCSATNMGRLHSHVSGFIANL